jgi:hypothetical protein
MRLASPALCLGTLVSVAIPHKSASAGPAIGDNKEKEHTPATPPTTAAPSITAAPSTTAETPAAPASEETPVEYGLGVRLRSVWVPKKILQLFLERAAGGAQNYGLGVDLTRRRGTTELQLGFEYEQISVGQGVWINKGDDVSMGDEADYVLGSKASGHQLGWFTIEFTFLNHAEITKFLAVRYGGGIGVGIVRGELDHYNIICTNATNTSPEPGCVPPSLGGQGMYSEGTQTLAKYDLPPVFPVVNFILGLELKPTDRMTINLEGGIRTLPFVGISTSVFF